MFRIFAVVLSFTSELFTGRPFSTPLPEETQFKESLLHQSELQHALTLTGPGDPDWVEPMRAAPPLYGKVIANRKNWKVVCDSQQDEKHGCQNVIDGDEATFWLANRTNSRYQRNTITVDIGAVLPVSGLAVKPRQDKSEDGNIAAHTIHLSEDGKYWRSATAYGTWWSDWTEKYAGFEPQQARFVRLLAYSDAKDSSLTAISDFNVFTRPLPKVFPPTNQIGSWGPTINTPIVPVTAFVDPLTNKVILISSKRHDNFAQDRPAYTLVAVWDPATKKMTQAKVENTHHNMFCPGTAFDADGRIIVSGGATGSVTTIYNGAERAEKTWQTAADLKYIRGYHSAVLTAQGRVFVLGGSWGDEALTDPEQFRKNGEVYDPKTNTWTLLPKCRADKMMTKDRQYYRRDNHGWLFAWKNDTVFHAGPSKNMNWYSLEGKGGWQDAGLRQPSGGPADDDAMCGQAIMYDATKGSILTFGGARDYLQGGPSSNSAFHITLGEANGTVKVDKAESMAYNRTYAQAVVVPNGNIIVTGGQFGVPEVFNDTNPVLQAEMYSPETGKWSKMANNSMVRGYHSFTLLLPDATIMSGGGGLCGDSCFANHFDIEIYRPPYLFTSDGRNAKRPVIKSLSTSSIKLGAEVEVTIDEEIIEASIIRYSGTTHTVDNDQRRVPLEVVKKGTGTTYDLVFPKEGHVAIPGYWMLFVMNERGVPSVSKPIKMLIG